MKRSLLVFGTAILGLALAVPAVAHEAGQWIVRGGVGTVMPKDDNLVLPFIEIGDVSLDACVKVDDGTSLTLSATFMFTENWAVDILGALPFKHDIDLDATVSDGVDTFSGVLPFGEVKHLPPTVSVQYHFTPDADFQPFVGFGFNYTMFSSEKLTSDVVEAGIVDFSLDNSFGFAAQIGADWMLNDRSLINFDVRWIDIEADLTATIDDGVSSPTTGELGTVEIYPWVVSINYGYRF